MRYQNQITRLFTIATLIATPLTFAACGGSRQTYDPYFNDYHRWNSVEDGYYRRWEGERGFNHLDFGRRPATEQQAYFGWRHGR